MSRSSGFEQCHVSKWWDFIYCPATDKQLLSVAPGRKPPRPEDILGRRRHMDRPGVHSGSSWNYSGGEVDVSAIALRG